MAPVWWFAFANVAVAFTLSLGLHATLSLLTGRWWAHAMVAPVFFLVSLGVVHHALSTVTNTLVQAVFVRLGKSGDPAAPILDDVPVGLPLRSPYRSVAGVGGYVRGPWRLNANRPTRPVRCDEGVYMPGGVRLAMP